jgi:hypothetical protein
MGREGWGLAGVSQDELVRDGEESLIIRWHVFLK